MWICMSSPSRDRARNPSLTPSFIAVASFLLALAVFTPSAAEGVRSLPSAFTSCRYETCKLTRR